jgi:hypothetical protein
MLLLRWRPGNTVWSKNCTVEIKGRACWQSYTTARSSDFGSATLTRPWGLGGTGGVSDGCKHSSMLLPGNRKKAFFFTECSSRTVAPRQENVVICSSRRKMP